MRRRWYRIAGIDRTARQPLGVGNRRGADSARTGCIGSATASRRSRPCRLSCYNDRSGKIGSGEHDLQRSNPVLGYVRAEGPRSSTRPVRRPEPTGVKLLFELRRQPRRADARLRSSQHVSRCPSKQRTLPVFWLGAAEAAQSLDARRSVLSGSEGSRRQARPGGRRGRARQLGRRRRVARTADCQPGVRRPARRCRRMDRLSPDPRVDHRAGSHARGGPQHHTSVRRPLKRSAISRFLKRLRR